MSRLALLWLFALPVQGLLASAAEGKPCAANELQLRFTDLPIRAMLALLADFSGKVLVGD